MTDDPRYPLSWRQRRTPMKNQRRSKRWVKLYVGMRFEGTCWTLKEGPWRKIRKAGSVSFVRVLCDPDHGGCGRELDRKLLNIMQRSSTGCVHCREQRKRRQREQEQGATEQGDGNGQGE